MISQITSSATLRVLEKGALKTGTPFSFATARSIWFVPMQKQPTASRRFASASAAAVTRVLLRMPSTCTSRSFSARSSSLSAPGTISSWKPSPRISSCAVEWISSSRRTLICPTGKEVAMSRQDREWNALALRLRFRSQALHRITEDGQLLRALHRELLVEEEDRHCVDSPLVGLANRLLDRGPVRAVQNRGLQFVGIEPCVDCRAAKNIHLVQVLALLPIALQ